MASLRESRPPLGGPRGRNGREYKAKALEAAVVPGQGALEELLATAYKRGSLTAAEIAEILFTPTVLLLTAISTDCQHLLAWKRRFICSDLASLIVSYTAYEHLLVDVEDGVATVTFNRPEKYNALNNATFFDLQRAFNEIQLDRDIEVVVVEGAGDDAFSAGADIEQYAGPSEEHDPMQKERQDIFYDIYRAAYDVHSPVIAKIDGYCMGGGLIFAMFCDLRIADTTATFGVPVTDIGQIPTGGSTYRAAQLVGEAKAKELVYTAGHIDAEEAHRIGLINQLVEPEDLNKTVDDTVAAIKETGTQAVKNSKRAINAAVNSESLEEARKKEADIWWDQFATEERRGLVDEFNKE